MQEVNDDTRIDCDGVGRGADLGVAERQAALFLVIFAKTNVPSHRLRG